MLGKILKFTFIIMELINSGQPIIEILKELHKENVAILQAINSKSWWETFAPGLYIFIGSILTFITQWVIFRLQKEKDLTLFNNNMKKEINIKVAELFGKYKNLSTHFTLICYEQEVKSLRFARNKYLLNYYTKITRDEEEMGSMDEESRESVYNQISYYQSENDKLKPILVESVKIYREQKLKIFELLHQIHFYSKDKDLNVLIEEFYTNKWHIYKIPEKFEFVIAENSYLDKYYNDNVKPDLNTIATNFRNISNRILEL